MLKVGIFTPYVKNEVTLAATQLADWLVRCGICVSILSSTRIQKGVHSYWDHQVKRAKKQSVYKWAYGATHLCWFESDCKSLSHARLVASHQTNQRTKVFFFPNWKNWNDNDDIFLDQADRVISLGKDLHQWLHKHRPPDSIMGQNRCFVSMPTPAVVIQPRRGMVDSRKMNLLVLLTKTTFMDLGFKLFEVIEDLLLSLPFLNVTLLSERSLPVSHRAEVKRLQELYKNRVKFEYSLPYYKYQHVAKKHDWIYVANTRHTFASVLPNLIESTVPIICHDVPPIGSHLNDKLNARLIPCGLITKPYPVAEVSLDDVANHLTQYLYESKMCIAGLQRTSNEVLRSKQFTFERFIYKEFVDYTNPREI